MIRESVQRFPEKIMREQETKRDNSSREWGCSGGGCKAQPPELQRSAVIPGP